MQKLRERLKDQKGFTLVEMLLVVAIIAILIAVSVPMVNSTLDKAKQATDDANARDAAVLGSIEYLQHADETTFTGGDYIYYVSDNGKQGKLDSATTLSGYTAYKAQSSNGTLGGAHSVGETLKVNIDASNGDVEVKWE